MPLTEDDRWMRRALRLAGNSYATPNPMVGCVLVREGVVVGEGWTQPVGLAHAERVALDQAGAWAHGAVAYVTLEPCAHHGRTPPCADALIAAGVSRVVAAVVDSDPRVGGKGIERLRNAGITVTVGVQESAARLVNETFFHFNATGTPFTTLKAAMTLDGKIATRTRQSRWITGAAARRHVHLLRAKSGAVMVGIGTLLADDAQLTARLPDILLPRQPLRIIVDSRLRTPLDSQAVRIATAYPAEMPLLIATTDTADSDRANALQCEGVEIVRLPGTADGRVDLKALFALLASRQIISVLVEGGGELNAGLLAAGLAQKALFFVAPKIVGGVSAPTPVEGAGVETMAGAWQLERLTTRRFGNDIALEGYFLPHGKTV